MGNNLEPYDLSIAVTPKSFETSDLSNAACKPCKESPRMFDYINNEDADNPYCVICDIQLSVEAADRHVSSDYHVAAFRRYGCDGIERFGRRYYCTHCNENFRNLKRISHHIKSNKHLRVVKAADSKDEPYRSIKNREKCKQKAEPVSCIAVAKLDNARYFCHICGDSGILIQNVDVKPHVVGNRHLQALVYYACDKIVGVENEKNHCQTCDCEFPRDEIGEHVRTREHIMRVTNSSTNAVEPKVSEETDRNADSTITIGSTEKAENTFDAETDLHLRLFTTYPDRTTYCYECLICQTKFGTNHAVFGKNKDKHIEAHIRGENHGAAVAKYGYDKIVSRNINWHHCQCCNVRMIGKRLLHRHVKSEEHLLCVRTIRRDPTNFDMTAYGTSFIYAIKQNSKLIADTFYCWICEGDEEYHVREAYVKKHVATKLHKDSMKKYGCDEIVRRYDKYHCNRCDAELGDMKNVFLHIKEEKHRTQKSLAAAPSAKNMISNFILEENDSRSETSPSELRIIELRIIEPYFAETERNGTGEDLSLLYISCDPEALCRGTVPRNLQPYAKKIKKQQVDGPYCFVCDFEIPGHRAVDDHVKGKRHADALLRSGCDRISRHKKSKGSTFTCGWCAGHLSKSVEAVYRHIRSRAHLARVREARPELFKSQLAEARKFCKDKGTRSFAELYEFKPIAGGDSGDAIAAVANNEKPLDFNSIFSSISDDLSRMLAHLEICEGAKTTVGSAKPNRWDARRNGGKRKRKKKERFPETSPDRAGGFACNLCEAAFPRKAELHSHMANHFGEEFGCVDSDAGSDSCDAEDSIAGSRATSKSDDSSDDEESSKNAEGSSDGVKENSNKVEEISPNLSFR